MRVIRVRGATCVILGSAAPRTDSSIASLHRTDSNRSQARSGDILLFASRIPSRRIVAAMLFAGTAVTACSDQKRNASTDSDLNRDLQLAGQMSAQPQPTFQDTALSPQSAPVKASAPAKTPTPTRTARRERSMSPAQAPLDATPHPQAAAPIPAAAPAPALAPSKQIGAGTGIVMTSGGRICTDGNRPGDKIVATVDSPVSGTNGAVIPAGSKVVLEVASVTPGDQAQILFRVRSVYVNDSSYSICGRRHAEHAARACEGRRIRMRMPTRKR